MTAMLKGGCQGNIAPAVRSTITGWQYCLGFSQEPQKYTSIKEFLTQTVLIFNAKWFRGVRCWTKEFQRDHLHICSQNSYSNYVNTFQARLIQNDLLGRFSFEIGGNINYTILCNSKLVGTHFDLIDLL